MAMKPTLTISLLLAVSTEAFVSYTLGRGASTSVLLAASIAPANDGDLSMQKRKLLNLLRVTDPVEDDVLADPITKGNFTVKSKTSVLGGDISGSVTKYQLLSSTAEYAGSSDSFLNLLEAVTENKQSGRANGSSKVATNKIVQNFLPLIPPPLRSALATAGLPVGANYVPMRDLFTSPAVSYAYERGWRQNFVSAGFPGVEKEAEMAMNYFEPSMAVSPTRVLVDMSCATGLFTRRFAASGNYKRVLGCDYSASMLEEARRRIQTDQGLQQTLKRNKTLLDLVRLDVGRISMKDGSVDALHAGAAMHCWPDLPAATSEIYRVLKLGGRYFATTFLSSYFGMLQQSEGGATGPSRQAFQYFESVEQLRSLMEAAGFEREKVSIEVLGRACVVIRCEK